MFKSITQKSLDALHTASSSLVSSLVAPESIKSCLSNLVDVQTVSTRDFLESYADLVSAMTASMTDRSAYIDLSKKITAAFPATASFFPQ